MRSLGTNPQYPPGPYAPADMKAAVPPYPTHYGQLYPPPPQQGQPVTSPVGNGFYSFFSRTLSDHTFLKGCTHHSNAAVKAMASAPPMETATLVGYPPPPSYEESLGTNPQYPPGPYAPAPADMKAAVPPYPTQAYGQMYPPPPQQGQPVTSPVVSVQTVYVQPGLVFGNVPVQAHCPVCLQNVITRLEYTSGALVWLSCAGLAIFGCIYGCCLIPFCVDNLKDVTHHCPNCSSVLGSHRRI